MKSISAKTIAIILSILLAVCVIVLVITCVQGVVPRPVVNHNVTSDMVPHSEPEIPSEFYFENIQYTNAECYVSAEDVKAQIGTLEKDNWAGLPVFSVQGTDPQKTIAIKVKDGYYLRANNYNYWRIKLPVIISFSILTIVFIAGLIITFKLNAAGKIKKDRTEHPIGEAAFSGRKPSRSVSGRRR